MTSGVASVHLVETSLPLRSQQETLLRPLVERLGCDLVWHDTLDDVEPDPNVFTGLVAHEFFDALPFRVIQVTFSPHRKQSIQY
jgi:NADH dehydrogenase [ubiquinone] 1 alpha subcomplex assembly factor 7